MPFRTISIQDSYLHFLGRQMQNLWTLSISTAIAKLLLLCNTHLFCFFSPQPCKSKGRTSRLLSDETSSETPALVSTQFSECLVAAEHYKLVEVARDIWKSAGPTHVLT